jgi:hypothetical protein
MILSNYCLSDLEHRVLRTNVSWICQMATQDVFGSPCTLQTFDIGGQCREIVPYGDKVDMFLPPTRGIKEQ